MLKSNTGICHNRFMLIVRIFVASSHLKNLDETKIRNVLRSSRLSVLTVFVCFARR